MFDETPHILVVDDEPHNLEIICGFLNETNYRLSTAENGALAWQMLERDPEDFDVILLDQMMPELDGMEVIAKINNHSLLKCCPVILQTARVSKEAVLQGIQAGVYYYLTKPFEQDMLVSIVESAVRDRSLYKELKKKLDSHTQAFEFMSSASFSFQNLNQIHSLAALVANACPDPSSAVMGISELMINAIEHGNLAITYKEKSRLIEQDIWNDEVERRFLEDENINKFATLEFYRSRHGVNIVIKDQGNGFKWQPYLQMSVDRATDSHGRGIAMAGMLSFSSLRYKGSGNEVHAFIEYL